MLTLYRLSKQLIALGSLLYRLHLQVSLARMMDR